VSDEILLRDYVHDRSEAAFAKLMERHLPMVYSVCLRETGDRTLAEDATQAVFLVLARKAKHLRSPRALPSWLYQAARLAARKVRHSEYRQRKREQEAVPHEYPARSAPDSIHLLLDDAIGTLSARERDAVLLRFFSGLSVTETAESLGISEGAAQMRISRAIDKLQRYLSRRDAAVTGVGLVTLLAAMADREAAAALLSHASAIAASTQPGSLYTAIAIHQLAQGVIRSMTMAKLKFAAACGIALMVAGGGASAFTHKTISPINISASLPKPVTPAAANSKTVIVLDPGHGGSDNGSIAPDNTNEKALNLTIARLTMASLSQQGYTVRLTRDGDATLSIGNRVKLSQDAHAAIFVSIHCDMSGVPNSHSGSTVFYHGDRDANSALAERLNQRVADVTGRPVNGVKSDRVRFTSGFGVLRPQTIPCALIECGDMNTAGDLQFLESAAGQQQTAEGIASGIKSYLDSSSVTPMQAMQQARPQQEARAR